MKKTFEVISILIISIAVIYTFIPKEQSLGDPIPIDEFLQLGKSWMESDAYLKNLNGLIQINIKTNSTINIQKEYQEEMAQTHYLDFQIIDGIYININILDKNKTLIRNIEAPYLMDLDIDRTTGEFDPAELEPLVATLTINNDETGEYWPINYIILGQFQPIKTIIQLNNTHLTKNLKTIYEKELKNGDTRFIIERYNLPLDAYTFRPTQNYILTEYNGQSNKIGMRWDDFETQSDYRTLPKNYTLQLNNLQIKSTLLTYEYKE